MSKTTAFRVYLTAELLKLKNTDMARVFIEGVLEEDRDLLKKCGLSIRPEDYRTRFERGSEEADVFLDSCSEEMIEALARMISGVRQNGVYRKILNHDSWYLVPGVDLDKISVSPAESWNIELFERKCFKVVSIARDSELWKVKPYSGWNAGRQVEFRTCLAVGFSRGRYRIFDGIHRAIQLVRNGETTVDICCPTH
jgi:hypothetical protein